MMKNQTPAPDSSTLADAPNPSTLADSPTPRKHGGGPRTRAGKEIVSRNRLTHGLKSDRLLPWEDPAEHRRLHAAVARRLKPQDRAEAELAVGFAQALWRLRRIHRAEAQAIEAAKDGAAATRRQNAALARAMSTVQALNRGEDVQEPDEPDTLEDYECAADESAALRGGKLEHLMAYEVHAQRVAQRWLDMLASLRGLGEVKK